MAAVGAWYRAGKVQVESGSKNVVGTSTSWVSAVNKVQFGDIFTVDNKTSYEIISITDDSNLVLDRNFEGNTGANLNYAIIRNTSATVNSSLAAQIAKQLNQKQLFLDELTEWLSSNEEKTTLTDGKGVEHEVKTPSQMEKDVQGRIDAVNKLIGGITLVKEADFEARRAQNLNKFDASGYVEFGDSDPDVSVDPNKPGLYTDTSTPNVLMEGKTRGAILHVAGVIFHCEVQEVIKLNDAPDGTVTYNKNTGKNVKHADAASAFATEDDNIEVVMNRVDMRGHECFLQEITPEHPFVYNFGYIHSKASHINGVATTTDNSRPITYSAQYDGDTSSRPEGVDFFAASDANKARIAADPKQNIYILNDGRIVQWCRRRRTIAGAGNGDWLAIDSTQSGSSYNRFLGFNNVDDNTKLSLKAQGIKNTSLGLSLGASNGTYSGINAINLPSVKRFQGVFSCEQTGFGTNNECYFLVCGTVERLNQGAYHPSFNELGARRWNNQADTTSVYWFNDSAPEVTSQSQCFNNATGSGGDVGYRGDTGFISSGKSGRPDDRFYDAIYAGGQGGVQQDLRYSVYEPTKAEIGRQLLRMQSGEFRGYEKARFTRVHTQTSDDQVSTDGVITDIPFSESQMSNGDSIYIQSSVDATIYTKVTITSVYSSSGKVGINFAPSASRRQGGQVVHERELPYSLGHQFTQVDVIGNPANILATPDLANGWAGSWIPVIPDSLIDEVGLTRKVLNAPSLPRIYTVNNGATWSNVSATLDTTKNTMYALNDPDNVAIYTYTAQAKFTEDADNAVVYGGAEGLGTLTTTSHYDPTGGCLLQESLIGLIGKSTVNIAIWNQHLLGYWLQSNGLFHPDVTMLPQHTSIMLAAPSNNSPAVKALNYVTEDNGQLFMQYAYTELQHNGSNWGDDSKIHITDGQSVMTDLNGQKVIYGTARTKIPLGWAKNRK
ncbi:hypothetical protein JQC92_02310 [Shewanella sp. 202IG2-18]|uniref:hypothetical protein n=1 Tax=Parashewanella hymeniacidonis TaxID=2807618 RepID=UPI001960D33B|nr:hypothetical protein [Parashewanella hymeniacidonis]MBM7070874.1 hypothetical protein [Parashewanella hymeniacidonis]